MLPNSYTSLDMLNRSGIIPYDATAFIYGQDSATDPNNAMQNNNPNNPPQMPPQSNKDAYIPQKEETQKPGLLKKIAATILATYILGVISSRGKLNPIDGLKSIGSIIKSIINCFTKIFK